MSNVYSPEININAEKFKAENENLATFICIVNMAYNEPNRPIRFKYHNYGWEDISYVVGSD